jgi:hypothetical protein
MTLRIDKITRGGFTIFVLSGNVEAEYPAELTRLFELEVNPRSIVLDLTATRPVDREAVKFLMHREMDGIRLENCPGYVREWTEKERGIQEEHSAQYRS